MQLQNVVVRPLPQDGLNAPLFDRNGELVPRSLDAWGEAVQERLLKESELFVKEGLQRSCNHPACMRSRRGLPPASSASVSSRGHVCKQASRILLQTSYGDFVAPFNKAELDSAERRDRGGSSRGVSAKRRNPRL